MREKFTINLGDEDIELPAVYEVCGRCRGSGTHVNPAIDGHGISASDECWDDDDFREGYMSGRYDVICETCNGNRVVLVPDEDSLTPEQQAQLERWNEFEYRDAMERRSEMAWGY